MCYKNTPNVFLDSFGVFFFEKKLEKIILIYKYLFILIIKISPVLQ